MLLEDFVSEITYNVLMGTSNPTRSLTLLEDRIIRILCARKL